MVLPLEGVCGQCGNSIFESGAGRLCRLGNLQQRGRQSSGKPEGACS